MKQADRTLKGLWVLPVSIFLLACLAGSLAKWVFVLPRGHLLWDISLILLTASIFWAAGVVVGWAVFGRTEEETHGKQDD